MVLDTVGVAYHMDQLLGQQMDQDPEHVLVDHKGPILVAMTGHMGLDLVQVLVDHMKMVVGHMGLDLGGHMNPSLVVVVDRTDWGHVAVVSQ